MLVGIHTLLTARRKLCNAFGRRLRIFIKAAAAEGTQQRHGCLSACQFRKNPGRSVGFGTDTGHADYEYVAYEQLVRSCGVALLTVLYYLHRS